MILVLDSGSTKCDWVIVDENNNIILKDTTKGINPRLLSTSQINKILNSSEELSKLRGIISKVLFYGAGCGSEDSQLGLLDIFKDFFPHARINIKEDLLAAVHGTTTEPGVVCILGTGSNCCYYDGHNVHVHQASLGYMIMDEGSGNYFGKKLLNAYFYNKMPQSLRKKFEDKYNLSIDFVLKYLYEQENPSAYLAKYSYFLIENRSNPFIKEIISTGIKDMFNNLINCYKQELQNYPLHFVGSIAYYLQDEVLKEANERNFRIRSFVKSPIDNIIDKINTIVS
ncbi:N-acetylglucosamine kinase [Flavobacteriaceae bacterium KMM 6898]|nr:N-acetylglucosamine kinase [Flavobacteriaceae bacterium KMM 6898]